MGGGIRLQKQEDKFDEIIQLRASLGEWRVDNETAFIRIHERDVDPKLDGRAYTITESRGNWKVPLVFYANVKDVLGKVKALNQTGWKLVTPQYPELKDLFRNGKPITAMDVFEDAMDEMKAAEVDERTGLEFLMDNWK